jgi:hypothetical protein
VESFANECLSPAESMSSVEKAIHSFPSLTSFKKKTEF